MLTPHIQVVRLQSGPSGKSSVESGEILVKVRIRWPEFGTGRLWTDHLPLVRFGLGFVLEVREVYISSGSNFGESQSPADNSNRLSSQLLTNFPEMVFEGVTPINFK